MRILTVGAASTFLLVPGFLGDAGHQVRHVAEPVDIDWQADDFCPDLVLIDGDSFGEAVTAICLRLKNDFRECRPTAVLLSSGWDEAAETLENLPPGVDGVIALPIGERELAARLVLFRRFHQRAQSLHEEHLAAQEKRAALEYRFSALIEHAPDGVVLVSREGVMTYASPAARRMAGHDYDAPIEIVPDEATHPEDLPRVLATLHDLMQHPGESRSLEYRFQHSDGSWFWIESCFTNCLDVPGIDGIVINFHNIDARKRAEEAMRVSEERLRLALAAANQGLYDLNVQTGECIVSPEYALMLGYDPATFVETNARWLERLHPDDRQAVYQVYEEYVSGIRDSYRVEFRQRTREGHWIWILSIGKLVARDSDGLPLRMLGTHTDINERKQIEEELRRSRESYSSFVSQSHEAIYCTEFEEPIDISLSMEEQIDAIYDNAYMGVCNQAMANLYGIPSPAEFAGRRLVDFHGGKNNERNRTSFRRFIEAGYRTVDFESEEISPHGEKMHFLSNDIGIIEGGKLLRIWGTSINITDLKRAEAERESLRARLTQAQKMESIGRLAGGVAHDFNNMLSVILGRVELALLETDSEDPQYDNLKEIRGAAERSAKLTRQLLAFARQQTITPTILDLDEVIRGMLQMLRRMIGEHIELIWSPAEGLWPVKMDPSQLDQILANLCVNARDAIDDVGQLTIKAENVSLTEKRREAVAEFRPGDYVLLTVRDNGRGMDAETISHLFEPFFTTKEAGRGTGLGLSTVYGIVKQNDGHISVESSPGGGTSFRIYLPRYTGDWSTATEERTVSYPAGHEIILLVEDEVAVLSLTRRMLESQGYRVLSAGTPEDAMRMASANRGRIQLLLTDVMMPGMNGRDLSLRIMEESPGIACLYMSGYTPDVVANHGILGDGVHFLQKPFTMKQLADAVRGALLR